MRFSYVFGYLATLSVGVVLALPAPHHQNTPPTAQTGDAVARPLPLSVPHQSPSVVEAETTGLTTPLTTSSSPKLKKRHLVESASTVPEHNMQMRMQHAQIQDSKEMSEKHGQRAATAMKAWQDEFHANGHSNTQKAKLLYEEHTLQKHLEKHYDELGKAAEAGKKYHASRKEAQQIRDDYADRNLPQHEQERINQHETAALGHRNDHYMHLDLAHKACMNPADNSC
ncbi:hypothetical protein FRC17_010681 [Serendipita sp. 399]|nr:hypothetical protein FRC17_010681 [Serendipita sp. 399]